MGRGDKKRSRAQYEEEGDFDQGASTLGIGATLAHIRSPEISLDGVTGRQHSHEQGNDPRTSGKYDWKTVESRSARHRKNKRRRKEEMLFKETHEGRTGKDRYPGLVFAELHKLQNMVKVSNLRDLLLYCLADGMAPQFVSVRHHLAIRKAVVLFVPGLEKGFVDGTIALANPDISKETPEKLGAQRNDSARADTPGEGENGSSRNLDVATQTVDHVGNWNISNASSPDEYLPLHLDVEKLHFSLHPLADIFAHAWPVRAAGDDKFSRVHSPLHTMLTVPLSSSREEKEQERNRKGPKAASAGKNWMNKPTPVTAFLASVDDLKANDYVIHPIHFSVDQKSHEATQRKDNKQSAENGWIDTPIERIEDGEPNAESPKGSLNAGRSVFAIDCEMCKVEGGEAALTRISIVNWEGTVVMDELVKPSLPITDYLTPYSGMTAAKLNPVNTTLEDIQKRLLTLFTPQTIIIGHSLNSDLNALKMTHPFIIDTSILYPHPRGPPLKSSLKWLAQKYLDREIQKGHGATGHDSVEDARVCLDLVRMKCEKGPQWGSQDAERESLFKRLARVPKFGEISVLHGANEGRTGAIVDHGTPEKHLGQMAPFTIGCRTDAEIVQGIRRAVLGDENGEYIPGGGVDLTWARFRELETLRGWSNDYRNPNISNSTPSPQTTSELTNAVSQLMQHIKTVHDLLPPCSLLIVYSGTGDPRDLGKMQEMQRTFKREYATKKWDELSVKWTDAEEQALKRACRKAREGVGFLCVK